VPSRNIHIYHRLSCSLGEIWCPRQRYVFPVVLPHVLSGRVFSAPYTASMSARAANREAGAVEILVSPPDISDVRTGTTWFVESTGRVCLVMGKITSDVFNIAFWDDTGEFGDESTQASLIADDVLASCAQLIAEPLPELVAMIKGSEDEALAAASPTSA